jgi:rubrerythrin
MIKSKENLKAAFTGESQANRKYLAFAKKADEEGYPQIAKLFRAAAAAETVHARPRTSRKPSMARHMSSSRCTLSSSR